jgi:hypothetical protein
LNTKNGFFTQCTCLERLHRLDHVVDYLTRIGFTNKKKQDAYYKELLNNRRHRTMGYNLWMGSDSKSGHTCMVCMSSFLNFINVGSERLR